MALPLRAILFDLDGTLLDTAPDMAGALNALRREEGLAPLPYQQVRPVVSHGGERVVRTGFPDATAEHLLHLKRRFLDIYRGALSVDTRLFPGMPEVLDALTRRHLKAGIVTNKPSWLTEPLLAQLALRERFDCVVSGDTLAQRKPHPAPLLHAAALAGVGAEQCLYVGDAERDVAAAHAAGMPVVVANYGYLGVDENARSWGAEGYLERAADLLPWLDASGRA